MLIPRFFMETTMLFKDHLLSAANQALAAFTDAQSSGKLPNNPVSENHFFSVWVSKALKQKLCDNSIAPFLKQWQQQARTLGAGANLKQTFSGIKNSYQITNDNGNKLNKENLQSLLDTLAQQEWQVGYELISSKKLSVKKIKSSSIILEKNMFDDAFNAQGQMIKDIRFFIRGEHQQIIDEIFKLGGLLFKVTDYKSVVKFHGEYILSVNNNFNNLPTFSSTVQNLS